MMSRVVTKTIEVEDRKFIVKKYTAMDGLKIAKLLLAKVIPMFQDLVPLIKSMIGSKDDREINVESAVENLSLDTIAAALDKITGADFDYIVTKSLQAVSEILPAGDAPVMYENGTFGVENVEYDVILTLRLTCEAVMWGCGDFFDDDRLGSVMKPLFGGSKSPLQI